MATRLPEGYTPSDDDVFMNELQLEYFRRKLLIWRDEILDDYEETREHLSSAERRDGDEVDMTGDETDLVLELRIRGRERKLLTKIDEALERIADGTYGYCAATGKPIGLARLEARPTTSLCIEAQEAHERREELGNQAG